MKRVLVLEDNSDLAFGLKSNLEFEGYDVRVAEDGEQGLAAALDDPPDLLVLDLMLPGIDGFRVLRTLREKGHEMPVLILSARGEEVDKVRGFRLGADDFVTKPFGILELIARIDALLRRADRSVRAERRPHEPEFCFADVRIDRRTRRVWREREEVLLAPKEYDLLVKLLDFEGEVLSRSRLLKEVWGHLGEVATRTVDTHVAQLRRKLEDDAAHPRHILTVRKVGYRLQIEPESPA